MLTFKNIIYLNSLEKTIDSIKRIFSNSYIPLIILYLSKEGLLKVESNVDKDDPRVLLHITSEEILDFWNINKLSFNSITNKDIAESVLGVDFYDQNLLEKYDINVLVSCVNMISKGLDEGSYAFVYDDNTNNVFYEIKEILCTNSSQSKEPYEMWFFGELMLHLFTSNKDGRIILNDYLETVLFDSIIDRQQRFLNDRIFMQPKELTRIILSQYTGGSVYNPFAGLGSYHTEMAHGLRNDVYNDRCYFYNNDCYYNAENSLGEHYYAEEKDELNWAIGKLRLMFYHMDSPNYVLGDSIKGFEGEADNILCTPPFNFQIVNENGKKEYADHFVFRRGIDMLAAEGMMAVVVPMSFFNRKDTFDIRKKLVDSHMLSRVVFLPENTFSYTRISTAIIFAYKNSKRNKVKFVDATRMLIGGDGSILNIAAISNMIEHNQHPMDENDFMFGELHTCHELNFTIYNSCVCYEYFRNIAANDYDLSPSNYFSSYLNVPEGFKLERLENFVLTKGPLNVDSEKTGKVITNSDLVKDYQLPYIDYTKLEDKDVKSNYKHLVKKSLLLSSINELRPSLYIPNGAVSTFVSPNVLALYLNEKKINAEYLVGELSKDYVKEQVRFKAIGSAKQRIMLPEVLSLKILVPEGIDFFQKEKEIVEEQKTAYLESLGFEIEELRDKRHDEYVKMLRQRKHRLQQLMNEFTPAFSQLNNFRIKKGGVLSDDDVVALRTGETVGSYFNKLNSIVTKVEDLITNLVNKENWGESTDIDIDMYVDNIPQSHFSDKYEIQIFHDRDYEIWEEGEQADLNDSRIIKINEDSLSTLFENIIANASKWGFNEDVRKDYIIRITVSDGVVNNQNAVCICVINNGSPIHESVDRSRFFEWGYGTGTGIGTSQLKDIVEHYGGSIKLNEYPEDPAGFCTEYEIVLPLIDNE